MQWKNAWIVMRKDLDEFKKQKLVIGSIVAMPIILGVVLPMVMFVPLITIAPVQQTWDVLGLMIVGEYQGDYSTPWTNHTLNNTEIRGETISHAILEDSYVKNCVLRFCSIQNSTLVNVTVSSSILHTSFLENATVVESAGKTLEGENILSVDSNLTFTKTKQSEIALILPMMLNMVLMIFIIIPATLPTIIASYSIVGEKNNRSLEPLLATPTTDGELLAGKILSAFLPSMGATFLAFSLGVVLLDIVLMPVLGYAPLPTTAWLFSILLLAPTACIMSILACVLISSKVSDVRAAQQAGGFVVMPVVVLMLGVLSGFVFLSPVLIFLFTGFYILIDLALFYFTRAIFNREDILTKWT